MAFTNDNENPIFDCGKYKPLRTRVFRALDEDGRQVTRAERRPQGKYLMVIDSYGNEVPLKLTNAISEQAPMDPYGLHIRAAKLRANPEWGTQPMVPSLLCPQQTEYQFLMPEHLQNGVRCMQAADGQAIGEARDGSLHWCKCISKLVEERREANRKLEEARDPKTTIQQALMNNSQATTEKLTELLGHLVASGAIGKPEERKGKDKDR